MGISDYLYSITDLLKRNLRDSVKNVCQTTCDYTSNGLRTTYDYSGFGLGKVDNAVRNVKLPDAKTRSDIFQFSQILAKNIAIEGIKFVPGGRWIYNVSDKTYNDYRSVSGEQNEKMKALTAEIARLKKERGASSSINLSDEQAEKTKYAEESTSHRSLHSDSDFYQKPEDMLRIFMMTEFVGRDLFNDLIVPQVKSRKNM